jgi:hemoglobin
MNDITSREDILNLVNSFYQKVKPDDKIGVFFTSVVDFSFEAHIPIMVNFWEAILLSGHAYKGNPMPKHIALHHILPLKHEHFERWLQLWEETLTEMFEGPVADEALNRARTISALMQNKLSQFPV